MIGPSKSLDLDPPSRLKMKNQHHSAQHYTCTQKHDIIRFFKLTGVRVAKCHRNNDSFHNTQRSFTFISKIGCLINL